MRAQSLLVLVLVGAVGLASCNSILGIEDHQLATDSGSGSGSGSDSGSSSGGSSGGDDSSSSSGSDSGSSSGSDASGDGSAGSECSVWANAFCTQQSQCGPGAFQVNYASLTDCVTQLTADCLLEAAAPGSGMTASKLAQCAGLLQSTSNCVPGISQPGGKCDFHGTGAPGGSCYFNTQCLSGACSRVDGETCGTCTVQGGLGDACGGTTAVTCPLNATCDNGTCVPLVGNGGTCDANDVCTNGYDCVLASAGATSGVCTLFASTSGATCSGQSVGAPKCSGGAGFHCAGGTCVADTYVAVGSPCTASDTFCIDSFCANGLCTAAIPVGSPCTVAGVPPCVIDSECIASAEAGVLDGGAPDAAIVGVCQAYAMCK